MAGIVFASFVPFTTGTNHDISAQGYDDWALWNAGSGSGTNVAPSQRKSGGGSTIGNMTCSVSTLDGFTALKASTSWTGGTPTGSGLNFNGLYNALNAAGIASSGADGSTTYPADTSTREAYFYIAGYISNITITGSLSDGSAGPVSDTSMVNSLTEPNFTQGFIKVTYSAASAGQTLTLRAVSAALGAYADVEPYGAGVKVISLTPVVQPFEQQTANVGVTATFSPSYSNTPTSYQWKKNGSNISGANSSSYTTPAVASGDNGAFFSVVATNAQGDSAEVGAYLFVNGIKEGYGRKAFGVAGFKRNRMRGRTSGLLRKQIDFGTKPSGGQGYIVWNNYWFVAEVTDVTCTLAVTDAADTVSSTATVAIVANHGVTDASDTLSASTGLQLWTPADLPNTFVWYIGDDPGNTMSSGLTTGLLDKSSGAYGTATIAGTGAAMSDTLNGRNTLRTSAGVFASDAAGNAIAKATDGVSFFVVHRLNSIGSASFPAIAGTRFRGSGDTLQVALMRSQTGNTAGSANLRTRATVAGGAVQLTDNTNRGTGWLIIDGSRRFGHDDGEIWVDGTQTASGSMADDDVSANVDMTLHVGGYTGSGADAWDQNIAEFIAARGDVALADRQRIQGYYAWTWGLVSQLDASHPYKAAPPLKASGDVTCTLAVTDAADTVSSTAAVAIVANHGVTDASDTASSAAAVAIVTTHGVTDTADTLASATTSGILNLAVTDAADTLAGAATVAIAAALSSTDAADTVSSTLTAAIVASLAVTDAADTLASAVTTAVVVNHGVTDAADTLASTAAVAIVTTHGITDASDTLASATTSGVLNLAVTDVADTVSSTATVAIAAALSSTDAADTLTSAAAIAIVADLGVTDTADTLSASTVTTAPGEVTCTLAVTDAADTVSSTAAVAIAADLAVNDVSDTLASATTSGVLNLAVTDTADSMTSAAAVAIAANLARTDAADTVSSTTTSPVTVTLAVTDTADTLASAAAIAIVATLGVTDAADTLSSAVFVGSAPITCTLAVTDAADTVAALAAVSVTTTLARTDAADTLASATTSAITVSLAVTDANDTLTSAAGVRISTDLAITDGNDSLASTMQTIAGPMEVNLAVTDEPDTLAATAAAQILASLVATDTADILFAEAAIRVLLNHAIEDAADTLHAVLQTVEVPDTEEPVGFITTTLPDLTITSTLVPLPSITTTLSVGPVQNVGTGTLVLLLPSALGWIAPTLHVDNLPPWRALTPGGK